MRYECVNIPAGVELIVVAMCADYERREKAISEGLVSHRTDMEYRYLNFKIYDAAAEIVGERQARVFINEIGRKSGYANSDTVAISETAYKIRKREVKVNIAKRLHLID